MVINGIGELHLRLVLEKLKNRGLHVDTKPPKIAYRETIQHQSRGPSPPQETDRRRGPVRRSLSPHRAAGTRRGFRIRRRSLRRHHPRPIHPRRRKRRARRARSGRDRRLSAAGCARHRLRRQASSGRQQGSRLPNRRQIRLHETRSSRPSPCCSSRSSTWK